MYIYFCWITSVHKFCVEISLHHTMVVRACEKQLRSFNFHPPILPRFQEGNLVPSDPCKCASFLCPSLEKATSNILYKIKYAFRDPGYRYREYRGGLNDIFDKYQPTSSRKQLVTPWLYFPFDFTYQSHPVFLGIVIGFHMKSQIFYPLLEIQRLKRNIRTF